MYKAFNFYELKNNGRTPEGVIILAYCLSVPFGKRIGLNGDTMRYRFNIEKIPLHIFTRQYIKKGQDGVYNYYTVKDPQSWFKNNSFLTDKKVSLQHKVEYLHILSQRQIGDKNAFYSELILDKKYWGNPLITRYNGNIHLTLEK